MAESNALLKWRAKQKRGAVMKPETFKEIVRKMTPKVGAERAKKIAGKAYWRAAHAKFAGRKRKNKYTVGLSKRS